MIRVLRYVGWAVGYVMLAFLIAWWVGGRLRQDNDHDDPR